MDSFIIDLLVACVGLAGLIHSLSLDPFTVAYHNLLFINTLYAISSLSLVGLSLHSLTVYLWPAPHDRKGAYNQILPLFTTRHYI